MQIIWAYRVMPTDIFSSLLSVSAPTKGPSPPSLSKIKKNSLTFVCNYSFFFCGLFFLHAILYVCTCVTFSCHWNIIRLDTLFSRGKKNTTTISMANDGTENWQKTVQQLFFSFFPPTSSFFPFSSGFGCLR